MGNLISNAIKFTPKGGRIEITLERVNSSVEVRVADTGIGIAADFLPHVFDRFRQAKDTSSKDYGGLGIGLAIAQHLVQLHGGTLEASSPGINQGAVFTVRLPIMASTPSAVRNAVLRTEGAPSGGSPPQSPGSHGR